MFSTQATVRRRQCYTATYRERGNLDVAVNTRHVRVLSSIKLPALRVARRTIVMVNGHLEAYTSIQVIF